jgi:hypothetical protein
LTRANYYSRFPYWDGITFVFVVAGFGGIVVGVAAGIGQSVFVWVGLVGIYCQKPKKKRHKKEEKILQSKKRLKRQ